MVVVCAAPNCPRTKPTTNVSTRNQSIQFHRFPLKKVDLLNKWLSAMRVPDFKPSMNTYLCSTHFKESDYETKGSQKVLKLNAVPSNFTHTSTSKDATTESDDSDTASKIDEDEDEYGVIEKLDEEDDDPEYVLEDEEETEEDDMSAKNIKKEKKIIKVQSQLSSLLGPPGNDAPLLLIVGDDGQINSEFIIKEEKNEEIVDKKPNIETIESMEIVNNDILVKDCRKISESSRYSESVKKYSPMITKPKENVPKIQTFNNVQNKEEFKTLEEKLALSRKKVKRLHKRCTKMEKRVKELKVLLKMLILKRGKGVKNLSQLFEEYAKNDSTEMLSS